MEPFQIIIIIKIQIIQSAMREPRERFYFYRAARGALPKNQ
jgi:hypothetical protein